jgi:hypothetical protein
VRTTCRSSTCRTSATSPTVSARRCSPTTRYRIRIDRDGRYRSAVRVPSGMVASTLNGSGMVSGGIRLGSPPHPVLRTPQRAAARGRLRPSASWWQKSLEPWLRRASKSTQKPDTNAPGPSDWHGFAAGHDPLCFVAFRQVVFVDVCKVGQSPLSGIITQLQAENALPLRYLLR